MNNLNDYVLRLVLSAEYACRASLEAEAEAAGVPCMESWTVEERAAAVQERRQMLIKLRQGTSDDQAGPSGPAGSKRDRSGQLLHQVGIVFIYMYTCMVATHVSKQARRMYVYCTDCRYA